MDIYPLYLLFNQIVVVNLSIDLYTTCRIELSPELQLISIDHKIERKCNATDSPKELFFHNKVVDLFDLSQDGIRIETDSQVPQGSGLGGSSSLLISMVEAISLYKDLELTKSEVRQFAQNIETSLIKVPTGTQDYLAAQHEGLNIFNYNINGIQRLDINKSHAKFISRLNEKIHLIYTGKSHYSAQENWRIFKQLIDGDPTTISMFKQLQNVSLKMKEAILGENLDQTLRLISEEWEIRQHLLPNMENQNMKRIRQVLETEKLITGLKGCGAGAGGSMIVIAEPELHDEIAQKIIPLGSNILKYNIYK